MYKVYQILPGEELENIASKLHIELDVLKTLNGIDEGYRAVAGNNLVIPNMDQSYFQTYTIQKGDSFYEIGRRYQVNPTLLATMNGMDSDEYIYPGEKLLVPARGVMLYITKENDTLQGVSDEQGVDVSDLILQNENLYLLPEQLLILKKEKFM